MTSGYRHDVLGGRVRAYPGTPGLGLLWAGQSLSLFGDQFMTLALLAVTVLGTYTGLGAIGLVVGSIVHCVNEGAFSPTSMTLRQTQAPAELLGRVSAVQRFQLWGAVALGALLASAATALAGLEVTVWIGALGTILCLPALLRRGIRTATFARG
ncbi:hypothetical protein [Nonomuraea jabiensis]|uniref:MFS transporter n=1 Tax=Nonomuraea jabiensis TaxID=882448 RepID=A0A7W9LFH8_9ACTN|nr:hypothetical protein [Nonomuraea jabiensis]MBB5781798.1 hypothetical protein [Nonomuraea jabiensis]